MHFTDSKKLLKEPKKIGKEKVLLLADLNA